MVFIKIRKQETKLLPHCKHYSIFHGEQPNDYQKQPHYIFNSLQQSLRRFYRNTFQKYFFMLLIKPFKSLREPQSNRLLSGMPENVPTTWTFCLFL